MQLRKLKLYSKNIKSQFKFYKNVLGFDVEFFEKNKIKIQTGSTELIFEEQPESNFVYHFALLIPNDKIEDAISFLEKKEIELLPFRGEKIIHFGTEENHTGRSIYFYDADGNIAEFIERRSLNFVDESPFSLDQILKINEIGLPAENPIEFSKQLIDQFNIQLIDPQKITEKFCWVGDYEGVFIVVKKGRNWLPTEIPAMLNDLWVTFESDGNTFEFEFREGKVKNDIKL